MEPYEGDVRSLDADELHQRFLDILHELEPDLPEDQYKVLEEANQRLYDLS